MISARRAPFEQFTVAGVILVRLEVSCGPLEILPFVDVGDWSYDSLKAVAYADTFSCSDFSYSFEESKTSEN